MTSRVLEIIYYMRCKCGNNPRLVQHDAKSFTVEAFCCRTITIPLKTHQAAKYEFQRLRAVQCRDPDSWPEDKADTAVTPIHNRGKP